MHEIRRLAEFAEVCGAILKNLQLQSAMPGENHRRVIRHVQPFMRVNHDAVGVFPTRERMLKVRRTRCQTAERRVNVQPKLVMLFKFTDCRKIVEINRIDRSGISDDYARQNNKAK